MDGTSTAATFNNPWGVAIDTNGYSYVTTNSGCNVRKISPADGSVSTFVGSACATPADGIGTLAVFNGATGITIDSSANFYVADKTLIRKISSAAAVSTLAGSATSGLADGTGTAAKFNTPYGLAVDTNLNVYVADSDNNVIRKINPLGGVSTFAGSGTPSSVDGTGTLATFYAPRGLAVDTNGNIFVAEYSGNKVRKITPSGKPVSCDRRAKR